MQLVAHGASLGDALEESRWSSASPGRVRHSEAPLSSRSSKGPVMTEGPLPLCQRGVACVLPVLGPYGRARLCGLIGVGRSGGSCLTLPDGAAPLSLARAGPGQAPPTLPSWPTPGPGAGSDGCVVVPGKGPADNGPERGVRPGLPLRLKGRGRLNRAAGSVALRRVPCRSLPE